MNLQTLLMVSEAAGVVLVGAGSTWFASRAEKNTRNVSNGFASGVNDGIATIIDKLDEHGERLAVIEYRLDRPGIRKAPKEEGVIAWSANGPLGRP